MGNSTRMTRQRALILEELCMTTSHPTADEIYSVVRKRLPRISLGTVYRNLELLAESNTILKLEYGGAQKRFDGNPMPHQHIRCECCGRVSDVMTSLPAPTVNEACKEELRSQGFELTRAQLELFGLCAECSSAHA